MISTRYGAVLAQGKFDISFFLLFLFSQQLQLSSTERASTGMVRERKRKLFLLGRTMPVVLLVLAQAKIP